MCSTNVECVAGLCGPVCWSRETTKGEGILPSTQLTLAIKLLSKVTFPDIHMIFRYGHQSVKMSMGRQVHFVFFTKFTKFSALCFPLEKLILSQLCVTLFKSWPVFRVSFHYMSNHHFCSQMTTCTLRVTAALFSKAAARGRTSDHFNFLQKYYCYVECNHICFSLVKDSLSSIILDKTRLYGRHHNPQNISLIS